MRCALLFAALSVYAAEPGYVDAVACRPCHERIFESYRKTGMGRSFAKVESAPPLADFFHEPSQRRYLVEQRAGASYLRRSQAGGINVIEKRIDYAIGSGAHSKTFLHRDPAGRLIELPVSWYSEGGGTPFETSWAMSPGYDRPEHSDFRR